MFLAAFTGVSGCLAGLEINKDDFGTAICAARC
jgi:hypothetical protein